MIRLSLFLAMLSCAVGAAASAAGEKPAPPIELQTEKGAVLRLADLKGRVVLVDFWASWCVPCKTSFPALDSLYREYHARGLEVVAVNLDERRKDADAFLQQRPHEMPIAFDPNGNAAKAFDVQGMPSSVIIDRQGIIRFTHMGYSDKTAASYRSEIEQLLRER